ncbi:MAG: hypothetical protein D3909_08430, partial [Candidatus Electrothrix sp. ATG1]|nr:hypothetical protein [Candidatus Electrothrix sp. ATG1]
MLYMLLILLLPVSAMAKPTTDGQARRVVRYWLHQNQQPLETKMGPEVLDVETFRNDAGQALYHVVSLQPDGFVIIAGDDQVEPIIAFISQGNYDPSLDNPLGALVSRDVPGRIEHVRGFDMQSGGNGATAFQQENEYDMVRKAQQKWGRLDRELNEATSGSHDLLDGAISEEASLSDVRVEPLLGEMSWGQSTEKGGEQCYNLYTPHNYVCGCVATAMSQVMRFYQHPTTAVGTDSFTIEVDSDEEERSLRGGNGSGGAYNWSAMTDGPTISSSIARQAIGALTHDTGVSVNMSYTSGSSATDTLRAADAFVDTFGYSNAIKGYNSGDNIPSAERDAMTNANLQADYPVLYGIRRYDEENETWYGHAVVCDGYGYDNSTMYHHLNMGWSGGSNAWYNLPTIDVSPTRTYTSVYKVVYNIYTSGSGEIVSGRVTDSEGSPISGVNITAIRTGGGTYNAMTNSKGIYALEGVPSASSYEIRATKTGYTFVSRTATIGTSTNYSSVGNVWEADFTASSIKAMPWLSLLLLSSPSIPTVTSTTGRVWMDRNLGASRVATSQTDSQAYGDLYQWGRLIDGHQKRTSSTTAGLSTSDAPGHGYFVTSSSDWRITQNNQLWQGAEG